jgi:hypothetical protein
MKHFYAYVALAIQTLFCALVLGLVITAAVTLLTVTHWPLWLDWGVTVSTVVVVIMGFIWACRSLGETISDIEFAKRRHVARRPNWNDYQPTSTREKWESLMP